MPYAKAQRYLELAISHGSDISGREDEINRHLNSNKD